MYECTGESILPRLLAMSIKGLDLSDRTFVCLKNGNVFTVDDLLKRTYRDLLGIEDLGKSGVDEVVEQLSKLGLCLSE
jgi:DNA-directed RNA polymerase subunit alpha